VGHEDPGLQAGGQSARHGGGELLRHAVPQIPGAISQGGLAPSGAVPGGAPPEGGTGPDGGQHGGEDQS